MARSKENSMNSHHHTLANVGIAGAQTDTVSRYGAAVKEHLTSYSGMDRENGTTLKMEAGKERVSNYLANYEKGITQMFGGEFRKSK